jgi:putative flippase GtrA
MHSEEKRMKEFFRFLKFALISASAGLIELGSFTLFNELLHWPYWLSYMVALVLSVVWNFTLNRKYTFQSAADVPTAMLKVALFYAVFVPASTWIEHYMTSLGINEYIVTIGNMLLNFVLEFLYQRYYVFRDSIDTNQKEA